MVDVVDVVDGAPEGAEFAGVTVVAVGRMVVVGEDTVGVVATGEVPPAAAVGAVVVATGVVVVTGTTVVVGAAVVVGATVVGGTVVLIVVVVVVVVVAGGCVAGTEVAEPPPVHGNGVPQLNVGDPTDETLRERTEESDSSDADVSALRSNFVLATRVIGPDGVNADA